MKELKLQRDIVQSVKSENGWAKKLSHRTMIGMPDLLINLFPFSPLLAEVKDLGPKNGAFKVKLDVTEKQRHELRTFDEATSLPREANMLIEARKRYASVILVGWSWGTAYWLAMLPPDATHIDSQSSTRVQRLKGGYYPFGQLGSMFGQLHKVALL